MIIQIKTALPALQIYPMDIKVNSLIAQAYLGAKRYDMAITHFELLFELGNDIQFNRKNLAWSYFNNQQWQRAIDNYEIYNNDYEDTNSMVHFVMSQAYLRLNKLELGKDYIEHFIVFKTPALDQEYLQLAAVYVRLKDYKNAFYATKKAKNEKPSDDVIGYQYVIAADQYFADKEKKRSFYDDFINDDPSSFYVKTAKTRAKDLRNEKFLSAKN
jgi:tetratricopeptide (TPR) repeat protein